MASLTAIQAEWALLLEACSGAEPDARARLAEALQLPIAWDAVLTLAERHGVSPLLRHSLLPVEDKVPASALCELDRSYQQNLHKCLLMARELVRILDCLESAGIAAIPYKGLALAETVYGDMALRQSGDIDLLIRPQDFVRVKSAVGQIGYRTHIALTESQERAYIASGYECVFDGASGPNLLEVQWALQPRFYAVDLDMDALFGRARTGTVAGRPVKALSPEDLLIVLSLHAAKHLWSRLIWLCDIARAATLPGLDWDRVEDEAELLGIVRILQISLRLANRLLHCPISSQRLEADGTAQAIAEEVSAELAGGASGDMESIAYFRRTMKLRERASDRMRFLERLALTPGPSEWKAVRLPASLFPLYRLVRLSRLMARVARV